MPKAVPQSPERLRTLLGFDVAAWARILGVPPITVTRWEAGTKPSGVAAEVLRGVQTAIDSGAKPDEVRQRLTLGLATLLSASLGGSRSRTA